MELSKKIYLAIPYSHPDVEIRKVRFELANEMSAKLLQQGYNVLSPISHSHPISLYMDNSNDGDFWCERSLEWLKYCDELWIYCLSGWKDSKGIKKEIIAAQMLNIPILYLDKNNEQ